MDKTGTAEVQGGPWGAAAKDWAYLQEVHRAGGT
jgi:hypothetical protein